jgi:nitrile hydratase accessory protein
MDTEGPAAPPRTNGELDFAEPWESRAFGMAVTLYEAGLFGWPQFKEALITRIARWEASATDGAHWNYYHHWLGALEDVLASTCGPVKSGSRSTRRRRLEHLPTNTKDVVAAITLRTRICAF